MNKCFEGWGEEFNIKGCCCCNCEYQRPINAHPWNKDFARGPISKIIGYGCIAPEFAPTVTFFDKPHGMCECWTERNEATYDPDKIMEQIKNAT